MRSYPSWILEMKHLNVILVAIGALMALDVSAAAQAQNAAVIEIDATSANTLVGPPLCIIPTAFGKLPLRTPIISSSVQRPTRLLIEPSSEPLKPEPQATTSIVIDGQTFAHGADCCLAISVTSR